MFKYLALILGVCFSSVGLASFPTHPTVVVGYEINITSINTNLGISGTTNAKEEWAIEQGAVSVTGEGGSTNLYQWNGSTTTNTSCTIGTNIIAADSSSSSAPATVTTCNSGLNWLVMLHKGYPDAGWEIGSTSNKYADLQGAVAWALLYLAEDRQYTGSSSTCLSKGVPSTTDLIQYRDAFCQAEIKNVHDDSTFQGDQVWWLQSNGGWPTPSSTQWEPGQASYTDAGRTSFFVGLQGMDVARGWTDGGYDSGTYQRADMQVNADAYWSQYPVENYWWDFNTDDGDMDYTSQTESLYRRPTIMYDSTRSYWILAATDSNDVVQFWRSTDRVTWTQMGSNQVKMMTANTGSPQLTKAYTRKQISLFYDVNYDTYVMAYVNADPNATPIANGGRNPCSSSLYGCWNEVVFAGIRADLFNTTGSIWLAAGNGWPSYSGPAVVCNDVDVDESGLNCVVIWNNVSDGQLYAEDFCVWTASVPAGFYTVGCNANAPYSLNTGGTTSFFTPSMSIAHDTSTNTRVILAVSGTDNQLYLNNGLMPKGLSPMSASNWGGWYNITNPWVGSGNQQTPYGGPVIRASKDDQNYVILLQSNTSTHP
jgi:hypothetical protein